MTASNVDVWKTALTNLKPDERQRLEIVGTPSPSVLDDVLALATTKRDECAERRLKFSWNGKPIILRDIFAKLASWLQRFVEVGDAAVQYDPGHAALPWAAVRFIISASIADIELYGVLMQGMETIANTLTRCAIQEKLYLDLVPSRSRREFHKALQATYVSILKYICYVLKLLDDGTVLRMIKAAFDTKKKLEGLMLDVSRARDETDGVTLALEGQKSKTLADTVAKAQSDAAATAVKAADRDRQLLLALNDLRSPIIRIDRALGALEDALQGRQRADILQAISKAPYPQHHKTAAKDRLVDSGKWLLDKPAYRQWRASSANSMLWLHGIPGSGKTKLTSLVVDNLANDEHIAYFYCARNSSEAFRARAEDILASIVRQLACTERAGPLFAPVVQRYKDALDGLAQFGDLAWTTDESLEVLLELVQFYPSITVVLDALDEVNPDDRIVLIEVLHSLIRKSDTLLKVFVSSRENYDIVSRLEEALDVRIYIHENAADVEAFIEDRIAKNARLRGKMDANLLAKVTSALEQRAQGMFRLVDLQIQTLSSLKTARDIEARLHTLPATLADSYEEIYDDIKASGEHAYALAVVTFQFLLAAEDSSLTIRDFAAFTPWWPDLQGQKYSVVEIKDVCSVFVSIESSMLRFCHLTVREYFESREASGDRMYDKANMNYAISSACLAVLLREDLAARTSESREMAQSANATPKSTAWPLPALRSYAAEHWWKHVVACGPLTRDSLLDSQLRIFILSGPPAGTPYRTNAASTNRPSNPLFFLSDIDREDILQDLLHFDSECSRQWCDGVSPIGQMMLLKRASHLQCILRSKPVGLTAHVSSDVIGILESALSTSDSEKLRSLEISGSEGKSSRHTTAENLANQIVERDPEAIAALVVALGRDTDLLYAVEHGHVEITRCLVANGIGTKHLDTALSYAYYHDYVSMAKILKDHGASGEKHSVARAVRNQLFTTATNFINAGFEVNGRYFEQRRTALHYAVQHNRTDIVQLLLQHGAEVNVFDQFGSQPHHLAARLQRWDCLALLQAHGVAMELPSLSGWTIDPDTMPLRSGAEVALEHDVRPGGGPS